MSGILSFKGYDYQTRVFINYILREICNLNLKNAYVELEVYVDDKEIQVVQLDFCIEHIHPCTKTFYEVKDREEFYQNSLLKPVIRGFYTIFVSNPTYYFELIHSCQITSHLKKMYYANKVKHLAKLLDITSDAARSFALQLSFNQIIGKRNPILNQDEIDLDSIALIDQILRQDFGICDYGLGDQVYSAIITKYAGLVSDKAEMIKRDQQLPATVSEGINQLYINVKDLINAKNSFIDVILQRLVPSTYKDRNECVIAFVDKYNIGSLLSEVKPTVI